jgi:hypothetical protein
MIIILHDLGRKYSQLMVGFLSATFEAFAMSTVDSILTEKSIVITVAENKKNY